MDDIIVVNYCGKLKKVDRSKLYELLLKFEIKKDERKFVRKIGRSGTYYDWKESNIILIHLHRLNGIQIYKDGCIRLFLDHDSLEYGFEINSFVENLFVENASDELLEILQLI